MKALAPAQVREVRIHPDTGTAEVIVPDFQLSLAIGKEGQNARLAARLTGWRVDIKSEAQLAEEESGGGVEYAEGEWVEDESGELVWQPAEGGEAISAAEAGYAAPFAAGARPGRRRRCGRGENAAATPTPGRRTPRLRSLPFLTPPCPPPRRRGRRARRRLGASDGLPTRTGAPDEEATGAPAPVSAAEEGSGEESDPVRMCVGCRRRGAPDTLVRLAAGADGVVRIGRTNPVAGHGCAATTVSASTSRFGGGRSVGRCAPRSQPEMSRAPWETLRSRPVGPTGRGPSGE